MLIAGCHPGDCHYINGNYSTARRIPLLKKLLDQYGVEHGRVRLEWVSASEGESWARGQRVHRQIRALGPLGPATHFRDETSRRPRRGEGGGAGMSDKLKIAMYWAAAAAAATSPCSTSTRRSSTSSPLRHRLLAQRDRLQVQGRGGLRRRRHRRHALQRRHPQRRERAHRQLLRDKSKVLVAFGSCAHGRHPRPRQPRRRREIFKPSTSTRPRPRTRRASARRSR